MNGQSNLDPQIHSQYLTKVREHAVDLFQDYYQLQAIRDKGTPQQREAIDRLDPLLRDMATSLATTLQIFNAHPARANVPYFPYSRRLGIHQQGLRTAVRMYESEQEGVNRCASTAKTDKSLHLSKRGGLPLPGPVASSRPGEYICAGWNFGECSERIVGHL